MRLRFLVGIVAAFALSDLIITTPAHATVITYESGSCSEWRDFQFPGNDCVRWEGPDGFSVTADMHTWIDRDDSFRPGFLVITGTPELDSSHMVFRRNDPFDLLSLDLRLGGDQPVVCPSPIEVRSSKGALLLVEPPAGAPDAQCFQYTDQGFDVFPYPWTTGSLTVNFSGHEWRDVDWFYVGFKPEVLWVEPRPRITAFHVDSVQYIPEPAALWLFGMSALAAAWRAKRASRYSSDNQ